MKRVPFLFLVLLSFLLAACGDPNFQNNPHGPASLAQMTPLAQSPSIPSLPAPTVDPHLAPYGFGASLQSLISHYGQPTKWSTPPLYAFADTDIGSPQPWPVGSLVIVTMRYNQAIEFSYVPGAGHPMTYQEAQIFAGKLLPADAQGPKTIQQENTSQGKCLAKTYQSATLRADFSPDDFLAPDGKDDMLGSVTVNFYPNAPVDTASSDTPGHYDNYGGSNMLNDTNTVNSVLVNLGSQPSC